jgi:hypothetical protein
MMRDLTPLELRGLRNNLSRMGNTRDEGVFFGPWLDPDLQALFVAEGLLEEVPAVRLPDDRARWLAHIATLTENARRILSDPEADWHRALALLREAEVYDQHMQAPKLWLTERGRQLVLGDGARVTPIEEYTRF